MSLLEELHTARKARLKRFSAAAIKLLVEPVIVTPEVVEPLTFRDFSALPFKPHPIAQIQSLCCMYFNISKFELTLSGRGPTDTVYARHVAMYLANTLGHCSLKDIGRRFSGRDHTTVLHAVQKIRRLILSDWTVAYDVARIEAIL